ncbi:DUF222 domain-containing protein [Pseudonocardia sp. GCM10023141]|uniref:DUF222 domain-containing protein n=1 Tax=Pseudonocardia sp. GCM10023141 TaxID=3252653 RepID=UPI00361A3FF2
MCPQGFVESEVNAINRPFDHHKYVRGTSEHSLVSTAWQASDAEILHGLAAIAKKTNLLRLEGLALMRESDVFNPYELGVLARRRLAFLDPDGAAPRDTPPAQDHLTFTANGEGFDLRGWLSTESAADLNTALSPLAAPQPADDGTPDPRTKPERDADALVDLARRSLTCGQLPVDGGERPHVNVTITLEDLESRLGAGLRDFGDGSMAGRRSQALPRGWARDSPLGGRREGTTPTRLETCPPARRSSRGPPRRACDPMVHG